MRYRRSLVAIATAIAAICLQSRAPSLSSSSPSALITQGEAGSVTVHGGTATLQDCMAWDAATHEQAGAESRLQADDGSWAFERRSLIWQ
jgi:hypothetical protein